MKRIAMYAAKYLMLGIAVTLGLLGLLTLCLYAPDIRACCDLHRGTHVLACVPSPNNRYNCHSVL